MNFEKVIQDLQSKSIILCSAGSLLLTMGEPEWEFPEGIRRALDYRKKIRRGKSSPATPRAQSYYHCTLQVATCFVIVLFLLLFEKSLV